MVTEREFRDFCTDGKHDNRNLEEWQGELICEIDHGTEGTEITFDGNTIYHSSVEAEIDVSDARIYGDSIATRQSATELIGGSNLLINEDYEHLL